VCHHGVGRDNFTVFMLYCLYQVRIVSELALFVVKVQQDFVHTTECRVVNLFTYFIR
jgi:hypothetical protein